MKKKLLAFFCAVTLAFSMVLNVFAAGSATSGELVKPGTGAGSATAEELVKPSESTPGEPTESTPGDLVNHTQSEVSGVDIVVNTSISEDTLASFASTSNITASGNSTVTATAVSSETLKTVLADITSEAAKQAAAAGYGEVEINIGTVFEINNGGKGGTFTFDVPNLNLAGTVVAFHWTSDGKCETFVNVKDKNLIVDVEKKQVTLSLTSTSPIAIATYGFSGSLTNPTSPKTSDPLFATELLAAIFAVGGCLAARKRNK